MVRKHLIRKSALALAVASAVSSPMLMAQEQELEEITVTGTRIRNTDGMEKDIQNQGLV